MSHAFNMPTMATELLSVFNVLDHEHDTALGQPAVLIGYMIHFMNMVFFLLFIVLYLRHDLGLMHTRPSGPPSPSTALAPTRTSEL